MSQSYIARGVKACNLKPIEDGTKRKVHYIMKSNMAILKVIRTSAFGVALALAGFAQAWPAHGALSVEYTVDGVAAQHFPGPVTPPENSSWGPNGYPGDTVELQSYTGTFDLAVGTSIQKINTLLWNIDYTYAGTATDVEAWSDLSFTVNVPRAIHIGAASGNTSQNGSLNVTWDNDFLGFNAGSTVTLYVNGYRVDITPLAVSEVGGSNFEGNNPWTQPNRDITARFEVSAVPEPTTMIAGALLLLPLGVSGLRMLRQNCKA